MRINSTSLDNPLVVLANEALEVVAIEKQLHVCRAARHAEYLNIDPTGFSGAGSGAGRAVATKVSHRDRRDRQKKKISLGSLGHMSDRSPVKRVAMLYCIRMDVGAARSRPRANLWRTTDSGLRVASHAGK